MQVVCSQNLYCFALSTGRPGSWGDSKTLENSQLYEFANSTWYEPIVVETGAGPRRILPYLLGDGGYPILDWLIPVFREQQLRQNDRSRRKLNTTISKERRLVENCIGVVKKRCRILRAPLEISLEDASSYISCCFALHNICVLRADLADDLPEDGFLETIVPDTEVPEPADPGDRPPAGGRGQVLKGEHTRWFLGDYNGIPF